MSDVREYIGARYIPLFSDPIEWDITRSYEPLTVVKHQGGSYVSKQFVPEGIAITDERYWILWADFNAQLEQYRQEVQQFNGRITANANAIASEADSRSLADTTLQNNIDAEETARIASDTTLQNNIDAKPNINKYSDDPWVYSEHQSFFMHGNDTNPTKIIKTVTDESDFKDTLLTSAYRFGCGSNIDMCAFISIANTYLANADSLYYGNSYTGISFEGDFDNPVRSNPRAHMNELSQMPIDCNAFTQLVGHGVRYANSTYSSNITPLTRGLNPMFKDDSAVVKQYWSYGGSRDGHDNAMGYGRMLSDGFAKFLYDTGRLELIPTGSAESLTPGRIYFSGNYESFPDRFLGITHCYIVTGMLNFNAASKIVTHAVAQGLISQGITDTSLLTQTIAAFTPNTTSGAYLSLSNADRAVYYTEKNLSTSPIDFDFDDMSATPQYGARIISFSKTGAGEVVPILIEAVNKKTNAVVSTNRNATSAPSVLYLPYGYTVKLSSTSNTPVNITLQTCSSDRNIVVARPS